ncbi:hypothetical protein JMF89_13270 [Clostridiaceae bacterium UIB06]|nr:hypothetical protein [Clostridiaceae bacterium UIB06]
MSARVLSILNIMFGRGYFTIFINIKGFMINKCRDDYQIITLLEQAKEFQIER